MDENKKYHNPDDDGINNESDNDTYDPYEEYVKDKVHEEIGRASCRERV